MNAFKSLPNASLRLWRLPFALLAAAVWWSSADPVAAQDLQLPLLKTKTGDYTNVTVTSKSSTEVYIMHAGGVQNLKMHELGEEALEALGYEKPRDRKKEAEAAANQAMGKFMDALPREPGDSENTSQAGPVKLEDVFRAANWKNLTAEKLGDNLGALGIGLLFYVGLVSCFRTICIKAGYRPGVKIFIPFVQVFPIFRAAE